MHTKDVLAEELRKVNLTEMADRAAAGFYHDFLSPLDMPCVTLCNDLAVAASKNRDYSAAIMTLRERAKNGDFDASPDESDEWAGSPEGQETFRKLKR